jgi:hypothetical protein
MSSDSTVAVLYLILMFRAFLAICAIENGPKLLMGASPAGSTPTLSAHISY